jgi:hypothetical protein
MTRCDLRDVVFKTPDATARQNVCQRDGLEQMMTLFVLQPVAFHHAVVQHCIVEPHQT